MFGQIAESEYFASREHFVKRLWFVHDRAIYRGAGVLYWEPEEGFHVAANITRSNMQFPLRKEIKAIEFESATSVYLKLDSNSYVVLSVFFPDEMRLALGYLSEDSTRALFIRRESFPIKSHWFGSALFETGTSLLLPDTVLVETRIGEGQPHKKFSRDGIYYEGENGLKIIGYQKEGKYLRVEWSLPIEEWTKSEAWEFAKGLQRSISVLSGQALELKYREMYRVGRHVMEVFYTRSPLSLGVIFRPFDKTFLKKEEIIRLATFFVRGGQKADVAKKMFQQMVEASTQRTKAGQELLLSTILEAALRSIYGYPFEPTKKKRATSFSIERALKQFRRDFLVSSREANRRWKKITNQVVKAYQRLRHRNAHPDWLSIQGGSYSKDELEQSTNDMILLSRFYGYMIMGLAGFRYEVPSFPAPVSEWKPMMTIEFGNKRKEKESGPTPRAADTASPCATGGGFKPKNFRPPSCWTNTPCR